jgi:hypothetical protein
MNEGPTSLLELCAGFFLITLSMGLAMLILFGIAEFFMNGGFGEFSKWVLETIENKKRKKSR